MPPTLPEAFCTSYRPYVGAVTLGPSSISRADWESGRVAQEIDFLELSLQQLGLVGKPLCVVPMFENLHKGIDYCRTELPTTPTAQLGHCVGR